MKKIRRIYNMFIVHVVIDGLMLLFRVFDWMSRRAYALAHKAHKLFWKPVEG
jgi:hypothetical protein